MMNRMPDEEKSSGAWRRRIALLVSAVAALAGLIAVRGPDWISPALVDLAGMWRLSGPSLWHASMLTALSAEAAFHAAGPRGWQNAHVFIAWAALLCWLLALRPRAWRGLAPLVPALIAVLLSSPAAGLTGFGLALLVLSGWQLAAARANSMAVRTMLPVAAWIVAWLSPGALLAVAATVVSAAGAWPLRVRLLLGTLCLAAVNLTPRGFSVWNEAWLFLRWSPEAAPAWPALLALLVSLLMLAITAAASRRDGEWGRVIAPALLFLGAVAGQVAFLWAAALWMIPCWPCAREYLQHSGLRIRWWMQAFALAAVGLAVVVAAIQGLPRWYNLAMKAAVVQPTLTRAALPADGPVYINRAGLPVARFSGSLPPLGNSPEAPNLGREPSLWRALDRQVRYRAVWLLGEKSDYAPLARHLGESPDWRLAAVDATGALFIRQPRLMEFATEPAQELARGMTGPANRSRFLAATALSCLTAQALPEANELSASACTRSDLSSEVAAARALVLIATGQTRDALAETERAVALDPSSAEAWKARTEAFLHAGLADEAYGAARRAMRLAPGEAGTLWLAARSANAARAFQSEASILEELIALIDARGGDSSFYQLYLGQSYARQGLARPALRALRRAAEAPGLSAEQRRELEQEIADLEARPEAQ